MSPLPGGRWHRVIPHGTWVPVGARLAANCYHVHSHYKLLLVWSVVWTNVRSIILPLCVDPRCTENTSPVPRCLCQLITDSLPLTRSAYERYSPHSITGRSVPELIPVLGSQLAGDVSYKPGGRLPSLSARPTVTPQPIRGLLPVLLLDEQRHDRCELFA